MRSYLSVATAAILFLIVITATANTGAESSVRATGEATKPEVQVVSTEGATAFQAQQELDAVIDFLDCCAVEVQRQIDEYLAINYYLTVIYPAQVQAEAEARARSAPPARSGAVSTGTCGGATNGADQYIGRESGGNPNALNPSGASGCYQIMPATWSSSCGDLGPQQGASAETQSQCASRLALCNWIPPNYCRG